MANPKQGWILLPTALAWMAAVGVSEQSASAGPQQSYIKAAPAIVPQVSPTSTLPVSFESLDAGPLSATGDASLTIADSAVMPSRPFDEQPPMIPLPPSLWAGLATLSGVAWHTVRQTVRRSN